MNNTFFFSIVIANYNYGQFIEKAILSVINQDFDSYELIIIDGGSKDNSIEIIKKYTDKIAYWVSEPDKGQSDAFNKGFARAKGQYYFWLNADDLLMPHTLSKAYSYLQKHPSCLWLAGNMVKINTDGKIIACCNGPRWVNLLIKNGSVYVYGPTTFFHNTLLEKVGDFDVNLHYSMDTDLWYRFINNGYKFERLNHYCWAFRVHELSKTSSSFAGNTSETHLKEQILIKEKNNYQNKRYVYYLLSLFKIVSGCYIKSFVDSLKYVNINIFHEL
jgi:glycosyltransferase involved in cell wall biosynthesis